MVIPIRYVIVLYSIASFYQKICFSVQ
jgi:hypothetical protein